MNNEVVVSLVPIKENEREKFIKDLQTAFKVAVVEEYGDDGEEVISRKDIEESIDKEGSETYNIVCDGEIVGGAVININKDTNHNSLELLFVNIDCHSKGIGLATWKAIEKLHPDTEVWETHTPYFEKRNVHFYINKCGFHMVEFFNPKHPEPDMPDEDIPGGDYFCRFEKKMK